MRVEVGMKESSKKNVLKSTWDGDVEKLGDENLAQIPDAENVERKWRRVRPKLRGGIALKVT